MGAPHGAAEGGGGRRIAPISEWLLSFVQGFPSKLCCLLVYSGVLSPPHFLSAQELLDAILSNPPPGGSVLCLACSLLDSPYRLGETHRG